MTFARSAPLCILTALVLVLTLACSSSTSPTPSTTAPPEIDSGVSSRPNAPDAGPVQAEVFDAGPAPAPGPSFTVEPTSLVMVHPDAPAGQAASYAARVDGATLESGKPTMLLESTEGATSTTFAATTATHVVDGTIVKRRYRMRARIRTEDATGGFLWWRIDGPGFFDLDNMGNPVDRRIKGTHDWQDVSLVMDVPAGATAFAFGSGLLGNGKVWVGPIAFDEVGVDVPTTPHFGREE